MLTRHKELPDVVTLALSLLVPLQPYAVKLLTILADGTGLDDHDRSPAWCIAVIAQQHRNPS